MLMFSTDNVAFNDIFVNEDENENVPARERNKNGDYFWRKE